MSGKTGSCHFCRSGRFFAGCKGCGLPVCKGCARVEMEGFGCVSAWPVYYCPVCAAKRPGVLQAPK